jgi:antagonist of KipI
MFDPDRGGERASLLRAGDRVQFVASCPSLSAGLAAHTHTRGEAQRLGQDAQATAKLGQDAQATAEVGQYAQATAGQDAQATRTIRVIHPGHFTTIQDLGRVGHAAIGVPRSGAADRLSLRLGNRLVGNPDSAAALEMTLFGCTLESDASMTMAITGSDAAVTITRSDGSIIELPRSKALTLNPGERLRTAAMRTGARAYLCVAGGIDVPLVLGSRSTHVASGIGGLDGRALRAGDQLHVGRQVAAPITGTFAFAAADFVARELGSRPLMLTPGPHASLVPDIGARITSARLTVTDRADRGGVRLRSDIALGTPPGDLLTEPMLPGGGSVQLTPSGELIILGPDGPTTGGYAVVASVAHISMAALGQLRPGDDVFCEVVTKAAARALAATQLARLDELLPPIPEPSPPRKLAP